MSENDEIVCKLVPLYRFEIYYGEDGDHPYNYVIVSDSLARLIEAIAKRDVEWSDEGLPKVSWNL